MATRTSTNAPAGSPKGTAGGLPSTNPAERPATVSVRAISFAEIQALAQRGAEPVAVFVLQETLRHGVTFTAATLTPNPKHSRSVAAEQIPHQVLYDLVPNTAQNAANPWKEGKDDPVGHVVACDLLTEFGTHTGTHLFTSREAEEVASQVRGWTDPAKGRAQIFVADPNGSDMPLTPVFGALVNTSFVIEGLSDADARARVEAVLRAEFGDAMRPHTKIQARPAPDRRVNVYSIPDRQPLALNVLDAEVSMFMKSGSCHVEEVDPAAETIAVG